LREVKREIKKKCCKNFSNSQPVVSETFYTAWSAKNVLHFSILHIPKKLQHFTSRVKRLQNFPLISKTLLRHFKT